MNKKQIYNLLKVALFCTIFLFAFEVLFSFDTVNNWIGGQIENTSSQIISLIIVWIIMYIQVWLVPIPAYVVLLAATHTQLISAGFLNIGINDVIFYLITLSAYICGFITAYFIGYKWGKKAVEWAAGSKEDYDKWSTFLCTKGKWWYALTVLLPVFPDDLLCIVAGSVRFNFKFFTIVNIVCRSIGLLFMIESLKFMGSWNESGFPVTALCWGIVLLAIIVSLIVFKIILVKDKNNQNFKESSVEEGCQYNNKNTFSKDDNIENIINNDCIETNEKDMLPQKTKRKKNKNHDTIENT